MILRSIQVRNWRCFIDSVKVGPFSESLNVLYAPNGSGKSTLFEALCRGLLDGHRVTGREIEAIRPWGRSLAPTVTVEFDHESVAFRITKQFLDNAIAIVERKENGQFVRLAEGNAADEKARAILTNNPPGRGLARPENWGLAQVLWAPQGNLSIQNLSGDIISDIRSSLGVQVSGPGGGPIEKRIEEIYLTLFTPGGRLRSGKDAPNISRIKENLEADYERRTTALSQQQAFEETVRRVEDLRARRVQMRRDLEAINKTLNEARVKAETYKTMVSEGKQRQERLNASEAQYKELKYRIESIEAVRKEIKSTKEEISKLKDDIPLQDREIANREKTAAEAKAKLEDARRGRQEVDKTQEITEEAKHFLDSKKILTELNNLVEKINKAQEILTFRKKDRSELVAPDQKTLRAIRNAAKERDEAQVRISAALTTLEVVPEKKGTITVIVGEKTGAIKLDPEAPLRIEGSPEVVAELPGIARLRAWGPTVSIEKERQIQARAEINLKRLTEAFGTTDLDELEILAERAKDLDMKTSEAETQLNTLLAGSSLGEIEKDRSKVRSIVDKILLEHEDWKKKHPVLSTLEAKAQETKRVFIETVENAEAAWESAQSALTSVRTQKAKLDTKLEQAKTQLKSLELKLEDLTKDGKQDKERERELKQITLAWEAARVSKQEIEDKLSLFLDDPIATVDKLEKQINAASELATKALEEEKSAEGKLEQLAAQGTYSALVTVEEEIAQLQREIEEEQVHIDAIRLLYETLSQCRKVAFDSVVGPVELVATRTLQRIAGTKLGRLKFGESFEPAHVLPEISKDSVPIDSVSGGEREQIYLATRMALAEVIAKGERQLVVLDDVLTSTDAGRLARVMTILEEAAQDLQILILTCHPERYLGLEGAHFMDLEKIMQS